ncbi:MAG: FkbM family methyltransferase [Bacteroidetes bacterium]|nr:MAG: FkbM family methyltransferase [Bacteroidota bacterium]
MSISPGNKKSFLKRLLNFKMVFKFIAESLHIIRQGNTFRDKLILAEYFLKIPFFLFKSLVTAKEFMVIQEKYKKLIGRVTMKNKYGKFLCERNIMSVYIINDNYQKKFDGCLYLKEGVFMDVGAHIGKYSVCIGKMLGEKGKVIALEPETFNFELLKQNVKLNKLDNILCLQKAVYSHKTKIPFYTTKDFGEGYHSLVKMPETILQSEIQVDTLDNIVCDFKIQRVDLIKIDTECVEAKILQGTLEILKTYRPQIIAEAWDEEYLFEIVQVLNPFGYQYKKIDDTNYFFYNPSSKAVRAASVVAAMVISIASFELTVFV